MKKSTLMTAMLCFLLTVHIHTARSEERINHVRAFLLSLALPGLGQYYVGSPGSAKIFIASELALWSGYYYTIRIEDSYRHDYIMHAANHAGVNSTNLGASYLNALGSFDSSFEYNHYQYQTRDNPTLYTGDLAWEWDDGRERSRFKKLRERELDYENYSKYCVAGVILNHFLSGLNASQIAKKARDNVSGISVHALEKGLAARCSWSF